MLQCKSAVMHIASNGRAIASNWVVLNNSQFDIGICNGQIENLQEELSFSHPLGAPVDSARRGAAAKIEGLGPALAIALFLSKSIFQKRIPFSKIPVSGDRCALYACPRETLLPTKLFSHAQLFISIAQCRLE